MLDLHSQLAILSKGFQAKSLILSDLAKNVNNNTAALRKLSSTPGENEETFNKTIDDADVWPGIGQLYEAAAGKVAFQQDRSDMVQYACEDIISRFGKVLDDERGIV